MDGGSCKDGHNSIGVLMALTEHITKAKVTSDSHTSTKF